MNKNTHTKQSFLYICVRIINDFILMEKIEMEVKQINPSRMSIFYDVLLVEKGGERTLDIPIGKAEAECMSLSMDLTNTSRPLTYDSYIKTLEMFDINLLEVVVSRFYDGTYYSFAVFASLEGEIKYQDMRTSDALNLALRTNSPIYASDSILNEVGFNYSSLQIPIPEVYNIEEKDYQSIKAEKERLQQELQQAVEREDYNTASILRDKIKELSSFDDEDSI